MDNGIIYSSDLRVTLSYWQDDIRYKKEKIKSYHEEGNFTKVIQLESEVKAIQDCWSDIFDSHVNN